MLHYITLSQSRKNVENDKRGRMKQGNMTHCSEQTGPAEAGQRIRRNEDDASLISFLLDPVLFTSEGCVEHLQVHFHCSQLF